LAVANDEDGSLRLYNGTSLRQTAAVHLKNDADNIRYDVGSRLFWVGYGEGGLAAIDPATGKQVAGVKLDDHPESFQLETNGKRIFVNVPGAGHVAVIDRGTGASFAAALPKTSDGVLDRPLNGCLCYHYWREPQLLNHRAGRIL
jgi:hypothetical protein